MIFIVILKIVSGCHKQYPHKMADLINKCVCSDSSTLSLPALGPPYFLRHNNVEMRPINNPTVTCMCSSKKGSHMSLTLNHKLEVTKLNEEGVWKAERGQKLGLLHETVIPVMNAKENFFKEIKNAILVNT